MIQIIPFRSGRRPLDEVAGPGHGCSEHVGYICSDAQDGAADDLWILFRLHLLPESQGASLSVRMSTLLLEENGRATPIPKLTGLALAPQIISAESMDAPQPASHGWSSQDQAYVATLQLQSALADTDWFGFGHCFFRRLRVELTLYQDGVPLHCAGTEVEVFDLSKLGTLYRRLSDQLLPADTAAQARSVGAPLLPHHHPWSPVLKIGTEKARLYLSALRQDLASQRHHLPDARWLLRVGLYLELLTCLGIFEAVKAEYPELLSPEERRQLATSSTLAPVRRQLNVEAWKKVWTLRSIAEKRLGVLSAGPVSLLNLLRKQQATLAFLHAHHDDLRAAIALAGPNLGDAQETWLRVFRDAERAVSRQTEHAFPELMVLPAWLRRCVLWRQAGEVAAGQRLLPRWLAAMLGDQDGVFPSAAREYRQSMNEVAVWARERGLMDYSGRECVPEEASLFAACRSGDMELLLQLQRSDGYPTRDLNALLPAEAGASPRLDEKTVVAALRRVPMLEALPAQLLSQMAGRARPLRFGPLDRVVQQGQADTSLYVVLSGAVEVLFRDPGGTDTAIGRLEPGALFGEYALLTGAKRTATVRAVDETLICELRQADILPLLVGQPHLIFELNQLMLSRQLKLPRSAHAFHARPHATGKSSQHHAGRNRLLGLQDAA